LLVQSIPTKSRDARGFEPLSSHRKVVEGSLFLLVTASDRRYMSAIVYILYSEQGRRYYIGHSTEPIEERLRKHKSNHSGFTARFDDWKVVHVESHSSKSEASFRERQLKGWKSRKRIEQLIAGSEHPD
jgi:putative endonuclease